MRSTIATLLALSMAATGAMVGGIIDFQSAMAALGSAVGANASSAGTPTSNAAPNAKEGATVSQALSSASSYWGNEFP